MLRMMAVAVALCALVTGCSAGGSSGKTPTGVPVTAVASASDTGVNFPGVPVVSGTVQTTPSGLRYVDLHAGDGAAPAERQTATIRYSGWLTNGMSFTGGEQELSFIVGARETIKGVDEAVRTMQVGGKRRLVIPPDLGYGEQGLHDRAGLIVAVPPRATIVVDIELLAVK